MRSAAADLVRVSSSSTSVWGNIASASVGNAPVRRSQHHCCTCASERLEASTACSSSARSTREALVPRRGLLQGGLVLATALLAPTAARAAEFNQGLVDDFEATAYSAYADRDFRTTVELLNELINQNPDAPQRVRWLEMRAQVLLDGKNFSAAIKDYTEAIQRSADLDKAVQARLTAGRALAHEGDADWRAALSDYDQAMRLAAEGGQALDPYVLNSRGNAHASLGQWAEAREDYLLSEAVFQQAKGFRGRKGSTTARLDGAVFAASNAAIMLAQLGDEKGALQEMRKIARRAPGSADMRAALAALYWAQGDKAAAEGEWQYACERVSVGCSKYQDRDWLSRIRRWPPRMVDRLQDFLKLRPSSTA